MIYSPGEDALQPLDYEVADVNFGHADFKEIEMLTKLGDIQNMHTRNVIRSKIAGDQASEDKMKEDKVKLNEKFIKLRDEYI